MRSKYFQNLTRLAIALAAALQLPAAFAAGPIDFGGYRPHYQGYGVNTPGGRGGAVCKVTNINDSGAGSFRSCVEGTLGPRLVVFETSGTIVLNNRVDITSPFVTVAGQTAPSPGITIRGRSLRIFADNVVLQHLRVRMGDSTYTGPCSEADAIYVRNGSWNIVFDHLSISWATHEGIGYSNFAIGPPVRDVALLDSIISENLALGECGKPAGSNSGGIGTLFIAQDSATIATATIARNLYASQANRNPWIAANWRASVYNNVTYNAMRSAVSQGGFWQITSVDEPASGPAQVAAVGNIAIPGPDSDIGKPVLISLRADQIASGSQVYLSENSGSGMTVGDQWGTGVRFCTTGCGGTNAATEANVKITTAPSWHTGFNFVVIPNASVKASVLASAGARPLDRDAVDTRIVNNVNALTGAIISSQTAVGGWPTLPVNTQTYNVPANANSPGTCGTTTGGVARTIIECDLETKARALEPAPLGAAVPSPPRNPRLVR